MERRMLLKASAAGRNVLCLQSPNITQTPRGSVTVTHRSEKHRGEKTHVVLDNTDVQITFISRKPDHK